MLVMEILRSLVVLIHLAGFAMLFGGWVVQLVRREPMVSVVMRIGLATQLVSGLILAIPFPAGIELNYIKLAVKFGVLILIGASFGVLATRAKQNMPVLMPIFYGIGVLAFANAAIAVLWT